MKKRIFAACAVALLASGVTCIELIAQPHSEAKSTKAVANVSSAEREAKLKVMIDAARAAYGGIVENHNLGRATSNNEIYAWSAHIRSCEARAAKSPEQVAQACQGHLNRMQDLRDRVVSLGKQGSPGGEMHKQAATAQLVEATHALRIDRTRASFPRSGSAKAANTGYSMRASS